ncbi:hypothetical protein [Novosphingobium album (ex Liu et al. 2023)]|uniref:Lipoprotein n=1 Tax=Novosphingobium album (ex Liu et al. 2023) TaxID=3031130 RepID=A0ABT5WT88_9SPHN|nr:hypothetical protein [Novosphingobium album (ex Liu et al. 2023)]MDE8652722.1 hypothetical protein [Novosphingobium album (ex Liu et al. 2023)]
MMRSAAFAALPLILLAACSSGKGDAPKVAEGDEHIACAVGGAKEFAENCAVERAQADGALTLTVRHPDGAFRRFTVVKDGRGLTVADGAEEAVSRLDGGKLEVTVGGDRYRFPATQAKNAGTQ